MSPAANGCAPPPSDAQLGRALARIGLGQPLAVERERSPYSSSFPLERLCVRSADGTEALLAFKRLEPRAGSARTAKPPFLFDAAREPEVYRSLLGHGPAGPPRHLGSAATKDGGRWLFVEWVEGRPLPEVGEQALWRAAARWLGEWHAALAGSLGEGRLGERLAAGAASTGGGGRPHAALAASAGHGRQGVPAASAGHGRLLVHDADYYALWLKRARRFAASVEAERFLARLAAGYQTVVERLAALPRTVLHGDFHAANVLVCGEGRAVRVAPVDWELSALGPGVVDLAALTGGRWSARQREAMVAAYAAAPGVPDFTARDLELARLHLAVQWLGWSPAWTPPAAQSRDWLAEALAIADGLGL